MGVLAPGTMLGGCRIDAVVGRGGMGVVYRARQLDLDRDVAVKVIAPELVEDPQIRKRFLSEARAAGAVEHPNVVPVHGAGIADGRAYLVMRYVDGPRPAHGRARRGARSTPTARRGSPRSSATRSTRSTTRGYVHRDVKPQNVMLDAAGHVYLSDFGLAKHALATAGDTRSEQWVGTLDYVAPEQIRGERVDARTDVYALGGVLYFMLTGHVPFERANDAREAVGAPRRSAAAAVGRAARAAAASSTRSCCARWRRTRRSATRRPATSPARRARPPATRTRPGRSAPSPAAPPRPTRRRSRRRSRVALARAGGAAGRCSPRRAAPRGGAPRRSLLLRRDGAPERRGEHADGAPTATPEPAPERRRSTGRRRRLPAARASSSRDGRRLGASAPTRARSRASTPTTGTGDCARAVDRARRIGDRGRTASMIWIANRRRERAPGHQRAHRQDAAASPTAVAAGPRRRRAERALGRRPRATRRPGDAAPLRPRRRGSAPAAASSSRDGIARHRARRRIPAGSRSSEQAASCGSARRPSASTARG